MRQIVPFILITLTIISFNAWSKIKNNIQVTTNNQQSKITKINYRFTSFKDTSNLWRKLGYTKLNDTSIQLKFKPISEVDFIKYNKLYNNQIDTNKKRIVQYSKAFSIKTIDSTYNFNSDSINSNYVSQYQGFINPLHLFLIYNSDSKNELGTFNAIDGETNTVYEISSPFDAGLMKPLVSPKLNWLLCYVNNDYETKISFLSLIKVEPKGAYIKYSDYLGYNSNKWQIDNAVWINERTFALKVYDKYYEHMPDKRIEERHKNIRYLKVSF